MDLNKWNVREFKLEDPDGDVAFILYRPITHGWRTRHLELSLGIQRTIGSLSPGDGEPSPEDIDAIVASQQDANRLLTQFRSEVLSDLIVGCRDLTINDEVPSRDDLVEALMLMEDLATDLCAHIIEEGSVSEEEGKS